MITDREIWNKFKLGDDESFTLIYNNSSRKLYLYGLKFTTNHPIIEDSIQDLFLDLVRNRKRLGDTDNIFFYLLKSFKHRLFRQLGKEKRYNLKDNNEEIIFDIDYSVEYDIINKEDNSFKIQSLRSALTKLSTRQKEAMYLRFTEEFDYSEISEIMDVSIESCRNLIYRAIKLLKDSLNTNYTILLLLLKNNNKHSVTYTGACWF